jgi:hypothetical protein
MIVKTVYTGHASDFDGLLGRWAVRHRRLKCRLSDCHDWEEFGGSSEIWSTLGGLGNVDDNVLELPSGSYRAMTMRAFNEKTRQWSIWWLDARHPVIEPPVHGGFSNGVGTFIGDDVFEGRPIKVRFQWSKIAAHSAQWDQAFSADGGATWETNWLMEFNRVEN